MKKRFASLLTSAALAGTLLCVGSATQAKTVYNMYLVPVSPLDATYHPGDTITFNALVDVLPGDGPITLVLAAAVGYDTNVFDSNSISATPDTSAFAPLPSVKMWDLIPPVAYSNTATGLETFQLLTCHTKTVKQPGSKTVTIPVGTYTMGTFSFPVLAAAPSGQTQVVLPSAVGLTGPNSAIDYVNTSDSAGTNKAELAFPNDGLSKFSSLTYTISPSLMHLSGFLHRQGIAPNAPIQTFNFEFRPTNGSPFTYTASIDSSGTFAFDVPQQDYVLHVKGGTYLGHNVVIYASPNDYEHIDMRTGDANNDNQVDIADLGILASVYSSNIADPTSGYDPSADFNGDGVVDIADFALLAANYTEMGDD